MTPMAGSLRGICRSICRDRASSCERSGRGAHCGANTLYASKPDGLTIGTFNTGLIYDQLMQREGVLFDLKKFSWIGKAAANSALC